MIGLVLEGGGAKGSYHVGAYKAILETGIEIQGVAGTSAGALNGAMIVQGDFDICYSLWKEISYSKVIDTDDEEIQKLQQLKLNMDDLKILGEKIKSVVSDRGFDITPFKRLLDIYIDEEKIRRSNKDFGMVTVNLTDFKPMEIFKEDIPYGELKNYLLASAYLPAFKTEKLGGKIYLDGAFYDNLPFSLLQQKGYRDLIIIRTHAKGIVRRLDKEELNAIVISPSDDIGKSYTYESARAKKNIQLGYYDALRMLKGLKGERYYIKPLKDKDYYLNFLLSIEKEEIEKIGEIIHTPPIPERRALFEYIVPKLALGLGLPKDFTYEELLIGLLEKKAEQLDIPRFKIYSFEELLDIVRCKIVIPREEDLEEPSTIEKIIEKVDLATIFNKEETILQVGDIIFSP
ncbi:patatin-like phospholipase family protein [Tissierellaceae bacterium HCP3S3_D8]